MKSYATIRQEVESLQDKILRRQHYVDAVTSPAPQRKTRTARTDSFHISPLALPVAFAAGLVFERLTYMKRGSTGDAKDSSQHPGGSAEKALNSLLPYAQMWMRARLGDRLEQERREGD